MPRPVVSDLTEDFYAAVGWLAEGDEENGWTLLTLCAAWVETNLDPVYELARERPGEPPWSRAFDPDLAPAFLLPFLAQLFGVVITPEMDEAQIRREIKTPTGWARGRTEAIKVAGGRGLTGTQLVIVKPRTPEVGHHYVRTLLAETPDPERQEVRVREATPAWEALDYEAFDGMTWADVVAKYATWADVSPATWQALREDTP